MQARASGSRFRSLGSSRPTSSSRGPTPESQCSTVCSPMAAQVRRPRAARPERQPVPAPTPTPAPTPAPTQAPTEETEEKEEKTETQKDLINTDQSISDESLLRPTFDMIGTDYFNKKFSITPLDVENSEWAEFDFVKTIDPQNTIEIDNVVAKGIRFKEPLPLPKYQPPIKPPSKESQIITEQPMFAEIQLFDEFQPILTREDMGEPEIDLSVLYNQSVVPVNFFNIETFNPNGFHFRY